MKTNFFKILTLSAVLGTALVSCVNNDDYPVPAAICDGPTFTPNKTVSALYTESATAVKQYTEADTIAAYVVSSDERGNFFKVVYLQTHPSEGTPVGFSLAIDETSMFGKGMYPGSKVYVSLKDLYYGRVNSGLSIGALYNGSVGRIATNEYKKHVTIGCPAVNEEELVRQMTLSQALNNANLNTLIELTNVQFDDAFVGGKYYDANDTANTAGGSTNRALVSAAGGAAVVQVRTSGYANFSGATIPSGSGTVRGVLTKYGSTFQFLIRSIDDVKLDQPRYDAAPPIIGGALTFTGTFNENFETYALNATTLNNAINDAVTGNRYWEVKTFGNNKYIQASSFGGGNTGPNRILYMVPVNFDQATKFSFLTKDGYNNGKTLKVYYTTNYNGTDINQATLVDITSNFAISDIASGNAYATNFTPSGVYNIPDTVTGAGYFIFEYTGHGANGPTTNMQLDDIKVE